MRTEIDLDAAAAAGLIGEDQAIALRNFQATRDGMSGATSEKFQLFGGYADLVIGIGMGMIVLAVALILGMIGGPDDDMIRHFLCVILSGFMAAGLFALTRRINLRASPAMALVLTAGFAGFSFFAVLLALFAAAQSMDFNSRSTEVLALIAAVALHAGAMRLHWRQFRFPPTPALVIAAYAIISMAVTDQIFDFDTRKLAMASVALLIATGTMIAGIWWDLTDIRRETERSQVAFWLHCLAGVLMSRALFSLLTGSRLVDDELILTGLSLDQLPYVLAMVMGAAVISLLLDRRSLLVGCLLPTVGIFDGMAERQMAAITGLMLAGTTLIFFSAAWVQLRTGLLAVLPQGIAAQLPRTSLIAQGQRPTRQHKPLWHLR